MNDSRTDSAAVPSVDVLIVGSGPAGLTAALELARLGIRSTIITRFPWTAHTPRAHVINQRTMEIFRHLGVEDEMAAIADPQSFMEHNPWMTTMGGAEIARISAWGAGPADRSRYAEASPSSMCNLPQHLLEPVLLKAVVSSTMVDIRYGHEFVSLQQDDDEVTIAVRVVESGTEYSIKAPYLIGADGARSMILDQLGLTVEGAGPQGNAVFVWCKADLTRFVAHRPGILYGTVIPDGRAGWIMVRPWDEWIAAFPPEDDFDPTDHEAILARIHAGIGDTSVKVEIKNVSLWTVNSVSAPQYSKGRVFCMGDAVHRHSPWNGLGLNTTVADAHNLAWKIAMVRAGVAGPELLETYSVERAPVGKQIVQRSTETLREMNVGIPEAMGMRRDMSSSEMWKQAELLLSHSPEGFALREKVDARIQAIKGPGFNALGVEVGYRYRDGARIDDGTPEPLPDDPETDYLATTWPGARVPHVWLETGRFRVSTLDVVGHGRFTLLVGRLAQPWHTAASEATAATGVDIQVIDIGGPAGFLDPVGDWARVREVGEDGAVLVRPDAHVAWRAADASGAAALESAVREIVCSPSV